MARKKQRIPVALRQAVWLHWNGRVFEAKCCVTWCPNVINAFSFEAGHNIPESKGGATTQDNLRPICPVCNKAMGNRYTIDEFSALHGGTGAATIGKIATGGSNQVHPEPPSPQKHAVVGAVPKKSNWLCGCFGH